jgi:hypothetical protein
VSQVAEHVRLAALRERAERACRHADRLGSWIAAREADGWIISRAAYAEFDRAYRRAEALTLDYQLAMVSGDDADSDGQAS